MTDQEIKVIWQSDTAYIDTTVLQVQIKKEYQAFEKTVKARDRLEIIAGIASMLVFGIASFFLKPLMAKAGALMVIPAICFILYMLRSVKKYKPHSALPVLNYLQQYRIYLEKEAWLLDNIVYWYLLPCAIPLILFFVGMERYLALVITIPLNIFIYRLNKKAVKTDFLPRLTELDRQIAELEDNSESR